MIVPGPCNNCRLVALATYSRDRDNCGLVGPEPCSAHDDLGCSLGSTCPDASASYHSSDGARETCGYVGTIGVVYLPVTYHLCGRYPTPLIASLLGNVPSVPLTRVVLRNTLVLSLLVYLPVGSHNGWVEQVRACS